VLLIAAFRPQHHKNLCLTHPLQVQTKPRLYHGVQLG